jgi:hypothetical protein
MVNAAQGLNAKNPTTNPMRSLLLTLALLPASLLAQHPPHLLAPRSSDPMRQHRTELLHRPGHAWPATAKARRGSDAANMRHGAIPWPQQAHARPGMGGAPKDGGQVHRLDSVHQAYDTDAYSYVYSYDDAGRLIEGIGRDLSQNTLTRRTLHEYNGAGLNIRSTEYDWDTNTDQWVNSLRTDFTYDGGAILLSAESSYWDPENGQWVAAWNDAFTYDGNGELIGIVEQYYDANISTWVNSDRRDLTWTPGVGLVQETWSFWDTSMEEWKPDWHINRTFDGNGRLTEQIQQCWCLWGVTEPQWFNYIKDNYSYDQSDDVVELIRWVTNTWENPNDQNWYLDSKLQAISDGSIPYDELLLPFSTGDMSWYYDGYYQRWFNHKLLEWVYSDYEEATATWVETGGATFFYSLITLSSVAEQEVLGEWLLYPNPAGEVLQLQGPQTGGLVLTLRDLQGRTVLQQSVVASGPISLAGLSAGLYTYTLQAGGHMRHGKLLKN